MLNKFKINSELRITFLSYISIFFSGIITIKIFTYLMSPSDYGHLGLISSISSFYITTFVSPLMQGASRFYLYKEPLLSFDYVNKLLKLIQKITVITGILFIGYIFYIENIYKAIIAVLFLGTLVLDARGQWNTSFLHLMRKRLEYTFATSLFNWLKLFIAIFLFFTLDNLKDIYIVMFAWLLSSYISNQYSKNEINKLDLFSSGNDLPDKQNIKKFIINFLILNIFLWIQSWADKWIINYSLGASNDLGIFISYSQISVIPFVALNGLIIMYYGPIIYEKISKSTDLSNLNDIKGEISLLKRVYFISSIFILFIMYILSSFILKYLLGTRYLIDTNLFLIISISSLLFNYSQIQSFSIQCTGELKNLLLPNIIAGSLLIIINLLIVRKFGVYGAIFASIGMLLFKILILYFFENRSWIKYINSLK
jgi:O-antigen/teichoic acid export membrane protein